MRWFNDLIKLVQENRARLFAKDMEEETYKTLAKRYQSMLGVNCKNSWSKHHHAPMQEDDDDSDDSSIEPNDELHLIMVPGIVIEEV